MVAVDRIIRSDMIIHMTRTTLPRSTAARRAALAGVVNELNGAVRLLRCAATGRLVKQGVSMTHLHVMWRLEESGELAMSRLAEFLDVSLSNATGLIDRMEERGLVERSRVSDDRRVVLVRVTAAGQGFLHEIQIIKDDLLKTVLARLDDGQLDRLEAALHDFRGAIRAEEDAHPERFRADHTHPNEQRPEPEPRPEPQAHRREYAPR
jgi:DNA-binding MarR family transcriptional regulator